MPLREKFQVLLDQRTEHAALIFGQDVIADPRQQHGVAVARRRFHQEQRDGHERQHVDGGQVLVDIGGIDDVAEEVGAERGGDGGDRHQDEREDVTPPLAGGLLDEQAMDQRRRAVTVREQGNDISIQHS